MKLGFVTPRYGSDIVGGAETLVRDYATRLAAIGHEVTVLTTCARDHFTWHNAHPSGTSREAGVTVQRFPVTHPKDDSVMRRYELTLAGGLRLSPAQELDWVCQTGFSEPMLDAIAALADSLDALLFAPYLFASTVFGARVRPERSIVIPCLHDESYARFECIHETLTAVAGLIFNTEAERDVADSLIGNLPRHQVVGAGMDSPPIPQPGEFRAAHGLTRDFTTYVGRREAGKNFPLLLECVAAHNLIYPETPVDLVAMGRGDFSVPGGVAIPVHDVGYLEPGSKFSALAAAVATSNLSLNESFSYALMESWVAGTPVIVHERCAVTREHCEKSGGGVWISSPEGWAEAMSMMRRDSHLRSALAERGRRYVEEHYAWDAVLHRLETAVADLIG